VSVGSMANDLRTESIGPGPDILVDVCFWFVVIMEQRATTRPAGDAGRLMNAGKSPASTERRVIRQKSDALAYGLRLSLEVKCPGPCAPE
jgi:hypothetical protein